MYVCMYVCMTDNIEMRESQTIAMQMLLPAVINKNQLIQLEGHFGNRFGRGHQIPKVFNVQCVTEWSLTWPEVSPVSNSSTSIKQYVTVTCNVIAI